MNNETSETDAPRTVQIAASQPSETSPTLAMAIPTTATDRGCHLDAAATGQRAKRRHEREAESRGYHQGERDIPDRLVCKIDRDSSSAETP